MHLAGVPAGTGTDTVVMDEQREEQNELEQDEQDRDDDRREQEAARAYWARKESNDGTG